MAELLDLGKHKATIEAAAIRSEIEKDRLAHWKQMAVPGLHIPMTFPPAVKFAGGTIEDQVTHVFSEARELADDLSSGNPMWLMELMDLHHSIETLFRIITLAHGTEPLNNARAMVMEKNAERGYYQEDPEEGSTGPRDREQKTP